MQVRDYGGRKGGRSFEGTFSLTRIFCVHSCGGVDSRLSGPSRDLKRNFPFSSLLFFSLSLFFYRPSLELLANHGVPSYERVGSDRGAPTCLTGPKKLELNFRSFYVSRLKSTYRAGRNKVQSHVSQGYKFHFELVPNVLTAPPNFQVFALTTFSSFLPIIICTSNWYCLDLVIVTLISRQSISYLLSSLYIFIS